MTFLGPYFFRRLLGPSDGIWVEIDAQFDVSGKEGVLGRWIPRNLPNQRLAHESPTAKRRSFTPKNTYKHLQLLKCKWANRLNGQLREIAVTQFNGEVSYDSILCIVLKSEWRMRKTGSVLPDLGRSISIGFVGCSTKQQLICARKRTGKELGVWVTTYYGHIYVVLLADGKKNS